MTAVTRLGASFSETERMDTRIRTLIPAEFRGEGRNGITGKGQVRNVSEGGLFVGTKAIPEEGDSVSLKLSAPGYGVIDVTGLVWWTTNEVVVRTRRWGFGLRVLESSDAYQRLVADLR